MRNESGQFYNIPRVDISRSRFNRNSRLLTTFNAGKLIPIYCDEVLPGDTCVMDVASLVRMSTPIFPTMDNAYMDIYFFFVPNRLTWEHWKEFNGENNTTYWTQDVEYTVPNISAPVGGWSKGSVADYMGIPIKKDLRRLSALPFRGYTLIWNEFFRDQNYMPPAYFNKTDEDVIGMDAVPLQEGIKVDWSGVETAMFGGNTLPVAKYHDYFTSVLPAPQKGEAVRIPTNSDVYGAPVYAGPIHNTVSAPMHMYLGEESFVEEGGYAVSVDGQTGNLSAKGGISSLSNPFALYPDNLYADLGSDALGTISELRQAFQIQKLLERDARGGTRYTEILNAHFGVTSPDARLQRPEYLGGKRIPINIDQVLQTSATNEVSPQGNTAAFSLTTDVSSSFTKSFVEHGYIIGLACVRTDHTYQQGIDRHWLRHRRFDYYWPELANISEQPVYTEEIYARGGDEDGDVFGYQEAWADYRYKTSKITGAFRSTYDQSLDAWHYGDYFETDGAFVADRTFMAETPVNIDRTLAVQSSVEDQFLANFYFKATWTRPMPMYSVPGLADHH